jgi:cysteine desulfurase
MRRVYLDWNATTPPLPEVIEAMAAAARETWANPASVHAFGRAARAKVEDAREAVARLAACDPRDVVLTSGGTEANNLAIRGVLKKDAGVLVTSRLEHPSVTRVAETLEREGKAEVYWARALEDGRVDLEDVGRALARGGVKLVAIQAVSSETGVIQPVNEVIDAAHRAGAHVHVDAVQAFGRTDVAFAGADTCSLAAHKLRGPKGIGALVARPGVQLEPVLVGGSQERGLRPGTVDPVAAAGFAVAATHALASPARWAEIAPLRGRMEAAVFGMAAGVRVNGARAPRMAHVTNIAFPGWRGADLVAALDLEGVAASSGSACSAGTSEPSATLIAMGDREAALSSVRFSLGEDTAEADVEFALQALSRVLARSRAG